MRKELESIFADYESRFNLSNFVDSFEEIIPILNNNKSILTSTDSVRLLLLLKKHLRIIPNDLIIVQNEDGMYLSKFFVNYHSSQVKEINENYSIKIVPLDESILDNTYWLISDYEM